LEVNNWPASVRRLTAPAEPPTAIIPLLSMEATKVAVLVGCCNRPLALRVVKVLLKVHWLSVVVKTSDDWMQPIVKLFIVYYVSHFYGSVNITMSTTTYITIDSRKRASGNTCDAENFLDRTLQGVQGLRLSNMQFYSMIYNITQDNNTIAFSVTSSTITTPYSLTLAPVYTSTN